MGRVLHSSSVNNSPLMTYLGGGLFLLLVGSVVCESKITDETSMGDGERAMKGLVAAKVKMEKKIDEMSNFIENELQVKEIQGTQFKRRKRETDEKEIIDENPNPLAALTKEWVFKLLESMNHMNEAFSELTDKYNEKRNAEEALRLEQEIKDVEEDNDEVVNNAEEHEEPDDLPSETEGKVQEDPKPNKSKKEKHGKADKKRRRRRRRRRF